MNETTTTPEPLRGKKLMQSAVNQILAHPETWRQSICHCGTQRCVGGWIQILGGNVADYNKVREDIESLLGVSSSDASWIYSPNRTLGQLYNFAKNFDLAGFDRAGRDRDGFDRTGFDLAGRDRDGRDRDGFDCDGRDRAGRDLAGFDRTGFDRAGRDRDGRDRDGFDCDGRDRAGRDRDGNLLTPFEI